MPHIYLYHKYVNKRRFFLSGRLLSDLRSSGHPNESVPTMTYRVVVKCESTLNQVGWTTREYIHIYIRMCVYEMNVRRFRVGKTNGHYIAFSYVCTMKWLTCRREILLFLNKDRHLSGVRWNIWTFKSERFVSEETMDNHKF